jgi:hypothetical protein
MITPKIYLLSTGITNNKFSSIFQKQKRLGIEKKQFEKSETETRLVISLIPADG